MRILINHLYGDLKAMKTKRYPIIIVMIFLVLSTCQAKDTLEVPYLKAMKKVSSDNNDFMQIVYQQKYFEYDNSKVELLGYINNDDSRIYLSSNFEDPLQIEDKEYKNSWTILLYDNYQENLLLKSIQCGSTNDSLVEIHGTFHVQKLANSEISFYLTDINKIYAFDTRPRNEGGTGAKNQCYP